MTKACELPIEKAIDKALSKMPRFMHPDRDLIKNWDDLAFQLEHELDLGADGDTDPRWTARQIHAAKMFYGTVVILRQDWEHANGQART